MRQASPRWFIYTCPITVAVAAAAAIAIAATVSAINALKMWLSLLFLSTWADIIVMTHDPNYILPFELLFVSFLLQIWLHEIAHVFLFFGCRLAAFLVAIYSNSNHLFPWEMYQLLSNSRNWLYLGIWRHLAQQHIYLIINWRYKCMQSNRVFNSFDLFFYCKIKRHEFCGILSYGSKSQSQSSQSMECVQKHIKIKDKWDVSL